MKHEFVRKGFPLMTNNRATHQHHRPSADRELLHLTHIDTVTRRKSYKLIIKMGKTGGEGGGAQQMMYGFIFVMYAITAGVLFYVMFNRYVLSVSVINHVMLT